MDIVLIGHPQSADTIQPEWFGGQTVTMINAGYARPQFGALSEAHDFYPNYAALNSAIFESSVILTACKHAKQLFNSGIVGFLHTDITPRFEPAEIWDTVTKSLETNNAVGMVIPAPLSAAVTTIAPELHFTTDTDAYLYNDFSPGINIWRLIKEIDIELYEWAIATKPHLVIAHQFCCRLELLLQVGHQLNEYLNRIDLGSVGPCTPHVFERLVALLLAKYGGPPKLLAAFTHALSSHNAGINLYGPKRYRYYQCQ